MSARRALFAVTSAMSLRFLEGQVQGLVADGWEVIVMAGGDEQALEAWCARMGATPSFLPMQREISPREDLITLLRATCTLARLRPQVTNVGTPKAGLVVGLAAWATRRPSRIYTLHGLRGETASGRRAMLLRATERVAMASATTVVCVSHSLRARVEELGLTRPGKLTVLGGGSVNGVSAPDLEHLSRRGEEVRRGLGLAPDDLVLGFVGRFTRDKGVEELVEAYQQVRTRHEGVRLLMIGDFEEGDPVDERVRAEIEARPDILTPGFLDDPWPYYDVMDVLVLPTYREGFPTVALEAAAAATPVITTTATGAVDAVRPEVTGWHVTAGSADELAAAMDEALSDPARRESLGRAGREWVCQDYSPERVQSSWMGLYSALRRSSRRGAEPARA